MTNSQTTKFDNLSNYNPIEVFHHADYSIDQQSQLVSSAPTKNFLFTYPHLFLIFHHHRRKKSPRDIKMAQHSKSFDIFHLLSNAFVRLNLLLTALMSLVMQLSLPVFNDNSKAMRFGNSW